jgi:tetratricopeptide (TPR) repeat protein
MKNPEPPNEAEQHLEQAYNYKEADKFEDALREADAAIAIFPSLAEAHNLRGIALEELGHADEAVKAYRQAISLDPDFREAKENLSDLEAEPHLEQAYSYKEADKFEDALREADAAIKIDPSLAEAHNLRGIALEELGHLKEALEAYRQAIVLDPEFREAKNNLSELASDLAEEGQLVTDDNHQLVTVATFTHPTEANIAKTVLDTEGIWSFIADENINRLYPFLTRGIKLQVRQPDAERALELLNGKPAGADVVNNEPDKDDEYQLVTIDTFANTTEAESAKTVLDKAGIWSCINIKRMSSLPRGGITLNLQVRQPDAERAFELLYGKPEGTDVSDAGPAEDEEREVHKEAPTNESPIVRYDKSNSRLPFFKKRK